MSLGLWGLDFLSYRPNVTSLFSALESRLYFPISCNTGSQAQPLFSRVTMEKAH